MLFADALRLDIARAYYLLSGIVTFIISEITVMQPCVAEKCDVPLAPCPERLRRYIKRLNQESGVHAQHLRLILRAIQNNRQNNKNPEPYVVTLPSTVTIDLKDFSYRIRNDLTDVLRAIDPPELIERIRECPVCHDLYWAGREDKKTCDKHGERWRKRQNRQDIERREIAAAAEQRKQEARETLAAMTTTARSVIRAIMVKDAREFWEIHSACWDQFYYDDRIPRSGWIYRNATHRLFKDGYLNYAESAERRDKRGFSKEDRYTATRKLIELWNDADIQDLELD